MVAASFFVGLFISRHFSPSTKIDSKRLGRKNRVPTKKIKRTAGRAAQEIIDKYYPEKTKFIHKPIHFWLNFCCIVRNTQHYELFLPEESDHRRYYHSRWLPA